MINRLMMAVLPLLFAFVSNAQKNIALVKGVFGKEKATQMVLYSVQEGNMQEWATTLLQQDGSFAFALTNIKEGFFYLSDQAKRSHIRIYLKPVDLLELNIDESENVTLVNGSAENKVALGWYQQANHYLKLGNLNTRGMTTYKEFFPKLDSMVGKTAAFKKTIKTSNANFNGLMKLAVEMDLELTAMNFLMLPNSIHPKKEEIPAWYRTILTAPKYSDSRYLQMGETKRALLIYPNMYVMQMLSEEARNQYFDSVRGKIRGVELIGNDTLKGELVVYSLGGYKSFEEMEAAVEPYRHYIQTDLQKENYLKNLARVADLKKGNASLDFSYEDASGKQVKMSDLKGKLVLIDVWATWCGPCKKEIPHLKALEKDMHGKDIAIVSVSVDEEKDKQKWKDFIVNESLGGLQLYAKGWSDLTKFYQITGIPRFMLFDREGKIITVNAPRPSTPELKTMIEDYLKAGSKP